jgi:hypothetical protein
MDGRDLPLRDDVARVGDGLAEASADLGVTDEYVEAIEAPQDKYWLDLQQQRYQRALDACYRGTNALLTAVSVLVSAHLAVLALATSRPTRWALAVSLPWLAAGVFSWLVLRPTPWFYWSNNAASIEAGFRRMIARKVWFTRAAGWCVAVGVAAAFLVWALVP